MARNLDGTGNGGFFASLGGGDIANVPKGTPSAVLEYLRGRLRDANTKEALRATKLPAPSGAHASAITKLSNRVHTEVLYDEIHVACLESLKDEFDLLTSATTAPGLLKCFLNALLLCPKGECDSYATRPGNSTITSFAMCVPSRWACVTPVNYCISARERLVVGHGPLPSQFLSEPPLFLITMCRISLGFFCFANFGLT